MTFDDFRVLLSSLWPPPYPKRVAVAVSGGADSLCLSWLLCSWARHVGVTVHAVTVDHGLRRESAEEARQVGRLVESWGLAHTTLLLSPPPTPFTQENARRARYEALALWCHRQEITVLFLGHHQEDQLETWAMRLVAGSGQSGLAGMRSVTHTLGLQILRPFLSVPVLLLRNALKAWDIPWIQDPSNRFMRFQRVRMRQVFSQLPPGEKHFWARSISLLNRRRSQAQERRMSFIRKHCRAGVEGYVLLPRDPFALLDALDQQGVLRELLQRVGGARRHPVATAALRRLTEALLGNRAGGMTCSGCFLKGRKEEILLVREWQRIPSLRVESGVRDLLWDGRFYLRFKEQDAQTPRILEAQGLHGAAGRHAPTLAVAALPAVRGQRRASEALCWAQSPFEVVRWLGGGEILL